MKKTTFIVISVLIFNVMSFAQHSLQLGFKGGANFYNLRTNGESIADHRTGFHVGALGHVHLGRHFALQPEVVFSQQGAKYSDSRIDKINYINVPVLAQYMVGNGLRLQTGPQVGFLVNAETSNGNTETDFESSMKETEVSWSFGAGYLTRSGLGFDARYHLGLTDITKTNSDLKNRGWQVGVFYQFR